MKKKHLISMAIALAGAVTMVQAAKCPDVKTYGQISLVDYGTNKCLAVIDADGDHHNEAIDIPNTITVDSVYYFRSNATSSSNQTIVLPFSVPNGCFFDNGASFYTIKKISQDNTSHKWRALLNTIYVKSNGLEANKPYIMRFIKQGGNNLYFRLGSKNTQSCTFDINTADGAKTSTVSANPDGDVNLTGTWTLKGVYEKKTWDANDTERNVSYGFASSATEDKTISVGQFVKAGTTASVPPMRAYLVYNSKGTLGKVRAVATTENSNELPASMDAIVVDECFQDGDGIFEVKNVLDGNGSVVKTACIDGQSNARMQTLSIPEGVTVDSVAYNRVYTAGDNQQTVYSTIVMPFNANQHGQIEGATFYKIANIKTYYDGTKNVVQIIGQWTNGFEANTPFIVGATSSTIKFNRNINQWNALKPTLKTEKINNPVFSATYEEQGTTQGYPGTWELVGTYEKTVFDETTKKNVYGFVANTNTVGEKEFHAGEFVKAGIGATVPPMRAYLKYNSAGRLAKAIAGTTLDETELPERIEVKLIGSDGETLAIGQMNAATGEITMDENKWFDMKGRVLYKKPTAKGTYYHKGQKVIIK
ncbi:hypothetical protein [Fibrobacter sp. UWEL]|uniref:hypothetical protein n=1 Tax=Fibrobacter sp. UWEL TaxID=1896209 RepID=UPI000919F6D2|nr:hypothetical protein [Fibrobacter sp. UWEL]SHL31275.1 hypothetical protein SAMN05720468_12157 [Fibrobacter sp. UWEL]